MSTAADSSAAPSITDRLRTDILAGEFAPGSRLIELQLTERYGVGRAAIRSAMVELDKEGLVTREANRGATVRSLSLEEAIEVYEARAALEALVARRAATRATRAEREGLRALLPGMRAAVDRGDTADFASLGRALHERIRALGGHGVASALIETLRNQSRHHPDRLGGRPDRARRSLVEHEAIIEAIVTGDGEAAATAVRSHIESILATLRS